MNCFSQLSIVKCSFEILQNMLSGSKMLHDGYYNAQDNVAVHLVPDTFVGTVSVPVPFEKDDCHIVGFEDQF